VCFAGAAAQSQVGAGAVLACQDLPRLLTLQLCLSRLLRILPVQALALQQICLLAGPGQDAA